MSQGVSRELTPSQRDGYLRDGYLVSKGCFDAAQVASWLEETDRLWAEVRAERGNPRVQWRGAEAGGEIADRLDPVLDVSPLFHSLAHAGPLPEMATNLLGDAVAVFKAKLIVKRPGTTGYKMHQDHPYWEFLGAPAGAYVTALLAFDRFDAANATIEVFPGLHHVRVPAPPGEPLDADEKQMDTRGGVLVELEPGDVALFHSLLPHRSAPNRSTRNRRGLYVSYLAAQHPGLSERYHRERITTR